MRLFHVSEEANIETFKPRIPIRKDLDQSVGLVWAIEETRLPNFLTPRECPRVCFYKTKTTTRNDQDNFFTSGTMKHVVVIESDWYEKMKNTTLYIYEFDTTDFELLDNVAGYYVAKKTQTPIAKYAVDDLFLELFKRNVEVRMVDDLWDIGTKVQSSSLNWSLCKMTNAKRRKNDFVK